MTSPRSHPVISRRRLLQGAGALAVAALLPDVAAQELPAIHALASLLAGRTPRWERLRLELPAYADSGQAVPMRLSMPGAVAPAAAVRAIYLFSTVNPVPDMAVFEFPSPPANVEIESRIRLAGSQRVVAVAVTSDDAVYAAAAEVVVTIAACLDGS